MTMIMSKLCSLYTIHNSGGTGSNSADGCGNIYVLSSKKMVRDYI